MEKKSVFRYLVLGLFLLGGIVPIFAKPKVLVMASAADTLVLDSNPKYPTGVFINELYYPVKALDQMGIELVFATPGGKRPTLDPESLKGKYWSSEEEKKEAVLFLESYSAFQKPLPLESIVKDNQTYLAILVPGGQGLMSDLLYDPLVPKILTEFQKNERPIGLICHAPALLTTLPSGSRGEGFLFSGYKVNSVTKIEEWFIESFVMKGTPKVRKISNLLKERGMEYESSFFPGRGYATRDRNLITSQNPFSGDEFNLYFLKAVSEEKEKRGL